MTTQSDIDAFYCMAQAAIAEFPDAFTEAAEGVVLRVVDWPPEDVLKDMGIADRRQLTGLYIGVPITERSVSDPSPYPDTVWLFREPILAEWRARRGVALSDLVAHVTVHEFAHHFGWSDEDIATVDRWWE